MSVSNAVNLKTCSHYLVTVMTALRISQTIYPLPDSFQEPRQRLAHFNAFVSVSHRLPTAEYICSLLSFRTSTLLLVSAIKALIITKWCWDMPTSRSVPISATAFKIASTTSPMTRTLTLDFFDLRFGSITINLAPLYPPQEHHRPLPAQSKGHLVCYPYRTQPPPSRNGSL